jgi:inner membrane protein
MASAFSHAVAALGIGTCFYRRGTPKRILAIGALCSIIPDLDVIGLHFGVRYGDFWGHRGFTHSLVFAALLAGAAVLLAFRRSLTGSSRPVVWAYFFLATASHGLLDAMTDGGLGVAFFSPFDNRRYFLPWTPIRVSPIGLRFLRCSWSRCSSNRAVLDLASRRPPRDLRVVSPSPQDRNAVLILFFAFTPDPLR